MEREKKVQEAFKPKNRREKMQEQEEKKRKRKRLRKKRRVKANNINASEQSRLQYIKIKYEEGQL